MNKIIRIEKRDRYLLKIWVIEINLGDFIDKKVEIYVFYLKDEVFIDYRFTLGIYH